MPVTKKVSLHDIDTTKIFRITMRIRDRSSRIAPTITTCGTLMLNPIECKDIIEGWLIDNKKWRGTFNKSLSRSATEIKASFDYSTLIQMLGCHGYPCTNDARHTIVKILNWKTLFVPANEIPSMWISNMADLGQTLEFELEFTRK